MRKSLRSLIVLVFIVASLLVGGGSAMAGPPPQGTPARPVTPANISWE